MNETPTVGDLLVSGTYLLEHLNWWIGITRATRDALEYWDHHADA